MTDTQVVVVGGGPVAMSAALLLAELGIESVMLEAKPGRDPVGSKALCMQRDVLDILDRVGVAEPLVAEGVTWNLGRTYYREHELFQITFPEIGQAHYPPFVNIGQDRTELWLESAVERHTSTEIRYGHDVVAISQGPDGVEVTAHTEADPVTVSGDFLVAADGARSVSRLLLDVDFGGSSFDDQFLICDIKAQLPFENERRFFFDPEWNPGRQVLIHPQAGSVWRIDWQVPPDFDLAAEQATGGLDARIRRIVGDQPYEIVWMSVYRFHQRVADRFAVGRCFLAGDAAHLMAPFGARGLNSGIQDAENLAWKLAYVLNGWSPESLLGTYDTERRAAALENLRVTGATMEFLVPGTPAQWTRRRRVLERAVTDEDAKLLVDSGRLAEPYSYSDSPLTTPPAPSPEPAAIVPGDLCPDVRLTSTTWLRQKFGRGVVVLATPGTSVPPFDASGPVATYDLGALDGDAIIARSIGGDAAAVVVRPDGHIAAVVADASEVATAAARAVGTNRDAA